MAQNNEKRIYNFVLESRCKSILVLFASFCQKKAKPLYSVVLVQMCNLRSRAFNIHEYKYSQYQNESDITSFWKSSNVAYPNNLCSDSLYPET